MKPVFSLDLFCILHFKSGSLVTRVFVHRFVAIYCVSIVFVEIFAFVIFCLVPWSQNRCKTDITDCIWYIFKGLDVVLKLFLYAKKLCIGCLFVRFRILWFLDEIAQYFSSGPSPPS